MIDSLHAKPSQVDIPIVKLTLEEEGEYFGILTEIGATSVGFAFPPSGAPPLKVGEKRTLQVGAQRVGSSIEIHGRVETRIEDVGRVGFRVQIGDDNLTALGILIERRGMQRVEPEEPMRVLLFSLDGQRRIEGVIEDLSATGVRVLVPHAHEPLLNGLDAMTICTMLPGDSETLEVVGLVRNREDDPAGVRVGFEFVARAAGEFVRILERVQLFVRHRQAQCLSNLGLATKLSSASKEESDEAA